MEKRDCPSCGFLAHLVCGDGKTATFRCERCGTFFKVQI